MKPEELANKIADYLLSDERVLADVSPEAVIKVLVDVFTKQSGADVYDNTLHTDLVGFFSASADSEPKLILGQEALENILNAWKEALAISLEQFTTALAHHFYHADAGTMVEEHVARMVGSEFTFGSPLLRSYSFSGMGLSPDSAAEFRRGYIGSSDFGSPIVVELTVDQVMPASEDITAGPVTHETLAHAMAKYFVPYDSAASPSPLYSQIVQVLMDCFHGRYVDIPDKEMLFDTSFHNDLEGFFIHHELELEYSNHFFGVLTQMRSALAESEAPCDALAKVLYAALYYETEEAMCAAKWRADSSFSSLGDEASPCKSPASSTVLSVGDERLLSPLYSPTASVDGTPETPRTSQRFWRTSDAGLSPISSDELSLTDLVAQYEKVQSEIFEWIKKSRECISYYRYQFGESESRLIGESTTCFADLKQLYLVRQDIQSKIIQLPDEDIKTPLSQTVFKLLQHIAAYNSLNIAQHVSGRYNSQRDADVKALISLCGEFLTAQSSETLLVLQQKLHEIKARIEGEYILRFWARNSRLRAIVCEAITILQQDCATALFEQKVYAAQYLAGFKGDDITDESLHCIFGTGYGCVGIRAMLSKHFERVPEVGSELSA